MVFLGGFYWKICKQHIRKRSRAKIQLPMKSTSFKEWSEKLQHYAQTGISKEVLHYWEQQVEQDVVILPVDGTISNPVSAVTEEITVVLNENETVCYCKRL